METEASEPHPEAACISPEALRRFTVDAFIAAGFRPDDAVRAADVLTYASVRGVDTHGIRNLKRYYVDSAGGVGQRDGVIRSEATPTVELDSDVAAVWNGNGGLGLSISVQAMESAIDKARRCGIGCVTVRNSTHFGAAGYYVHMATPHDMLGVASTGYFFPHGQEKAVVPFGGLLPMLSTNPIAFAFPADESPDFVLDMSTSVVPVNRIEMLQELGRHIPLGWALDAQHRETTDPQCVQKVAPLGGAEAFGGHKGYGLALAAWIVTSLISGTWRTDPEPDRILGEPKTTKNGFAQEGVGHFFAAVRLDQFGDPQQMKVGLDAMLQTLRESPAADPGNPVVAPGRREYDTELRRRRDGVPLPDATLSELRSLAEKYGLTLELLD